MYFMYLYFYTCIYIGTLYINKLLIYCTLLQALPRDNFILVTFPVWDSYTATSTGIIVKIGMGVFVL